MHNNQSELGDGKFLSWSRDLAKRTPSYCLKACFNGLKFHGFFSQAFLFFFFGIESYGDYVFLQSDGGRCFLGELMLIRERLIY